MANALDVAAAILKRTGPIPAMKLQKLVYYSQAWSLVWDDRPLFKDRIEAWANGPVIPNLYRAHRGHYLVGRVPGGDARRLKKAERETVDRVLDYYGHRASYWLSALTHSERPWKEAREGLRAGERGNAEIKLAVMGEYYGALVK